MELFKAIWSDNNGRKLSDIYGNLQTNESQYFSWMTLQLFKEYNNLNVEDGAIKRLRFKKHV